MLGRVLIILIVVGSVDALAVDLPNTVQFNRDVRPILASNCYACHGPDKNTRKADMRLDKLARASEAADNPHPSGLIVNRIASTLSTVHQVDDVTDLDLALVETAVSFRTGAANDVIDGVNFWGSAANAFAGSDPRVSNTTSSGVVQGVGTSPAIFGSSSAQLAFALRSKLFGATIDVEVSGLIPGRDYKVQLLLHDGWAAAGRTVDIAIEDAELTTVNYLTAQGGNDSKAAVVTAIVTLSGDGTLNINLARAAGAVPPNNPHLSGLIVNRIPSGTVIREKTVFDKRDDGSFIIKPGSPMDSALYLHMTSTDPDEIMPPPKSHKIVSADEKAVIKRWIEQGAKYEGHWAFIPPTREPVKSKGHPIDYFIEAELKRQQLKPSKEADRVTLARRLYFDLTGLPPTPAKVAEFAKSRDKDVVHTLVDELMASPQFGERMAMYWLDVVRYADSSGYHSDSARQASPYREWVIEAFNDNKRFDEFAVEQLAGDLLPEATADQQIASGFNMMHQTTGEGGAQAKEYLAKYMADRVRNNSTIFLGLTMGCAECHDHKFDPITTADFYHMQAFFADISEAGVGNPASYPVQRSKHVAKIARVVAKIDGIKKQMLAQSAALKPAQKKWEQEAADAVADIPVFAPWHVIGPFNAGSFDEAHAKAFPPETEIDLAKSYGTLKWEKKPNFVDGKVHTLSGDNSAVYLYRTITSPTAMPVQLSLGSDDSIKLWVNSKLAFENKIGRGVAADQDTAQINLQPGVNHVLYKITNGGGPFGFYFRVVAAGMPDIVVKVLQAAERQPDQQKVLDDYYLSVAPELQELRTQVKALEIEKTALDNSFSSTLMTKTRAPRMIRLLPRGNWQDDSGPVMQPAIPAVFGKLDVKNRRPTRLDLAKWIVSTDNPLTARNYVNRLWSLFYGNGISGRLDDLGSQGVWPTHPELLDWLAVEFVESGWDVKHMVRLMVTSQTYLQQSEDNAKLRFQDPLNHLCARQSRWRLDAEMVRDNALAVSGLLVRDVGGASVKPYQPAGYWRHMNFPKRAWTHDVGAKQYRRGLYTWWQRMFLHPSLAAFDAPSREESCVARSRSNTPQQALALLNDPTYVEAARVLAERMIADGGSKDPTRIEWAYQQVLSRQPRHEETKLLTAVLDQHRLRYKADPAAANAFITVGAHMADQATDPVELAAWSGVSRIILNLHETITRR
jgi:hypothetical protein